MLSGKNPQRSTSLIAGCVVVADILSLLDPIYAKLQWPIYFKKGLSLRHTPENMAETPSSVIVGAKNTTSENDSGIEQRARIKWEAIDQPIVFSWTTQMILNAMCDIGKRGDKDIFDREVGKNDDRTAVWSLSTNQTWLLR